MMRTFQSLPNSILAPYIDRFWGWESDGNEQIALPRLLPGVGAELYFHYRTPFQQLAHAGQIQSCGAAHLFCLRNKTIDLLPSSDVGFIAIRFRAGMVYRFTEVPSSDFMDNMLSPEDLWGMAGKNLSSQIASTETHAERLHLIQAFLLEQIAQRRPDVVYEHAATLLYARCVELTIDQLAKHLGIGRRQLERRFMAIAGQSPVEMRNLARFQKTFRTLMLDGATDVADAALAHGYCDQSHFIRHFQRLAAEPPGRHLKTALTKTHFFNTSLRA